MQYHDDIANKVEHDDEYGDNFLSHDIGFNDIVSMLEGKVIIASPQSL